MSTSYPPAPTPVPPSTPKKTSPWVWILGGCGVLLVILIVIVVAGGLFVAHKVKQAGLDPELMKKNPGLAAVKMMAAMNPNLEVLGVDDERGIIKVRDKKTGKTLTVNIEDAKKGKITFKDETGEELSIQGEGEAGRFSMKTKEGVFSMGGKWSPPSWVPAYPGATVSGAVTSKGPNESGGTGSFTTGDSGEKVLEFYESGLKAQGFEVQSTTAGAGGAGSVRSVTAHDADSKRTATIVVTAEGSGSRITINFTSKE